MEDSGQENKLDLQEAFQLAYQQIKAVAHQQKIRFHSFETLNTTAIVHEAYIKLGKQESAYFGGKTHFVRIAAKAIRHLLINYVEYKMAIKRGSGQKNESLQELEGKISLSEEAVENLYSLNEALKELEQMSPRQFQLVEARFFGGLTIEEASLALDISPATAKRDWTLAKAWLYKRMND